ncbi:hypothetical protein [Aeromonas hydrophila]|uniref:hypothetical protein n=1 Tax=Aeromonas hydrophila TaxID=644 RepID=UPI002B460891|nr:hypothetical protein [Aeromonas hydrophila]
MEKMRSDFESAIKKSVYALIAEDGQLCQRGDDGDYRHSVVQAAWWGWQVASASRGGSCQEQAQSPQISHATPTPSKEHCKTCNDSGILDDKDADGHWDVAQCPDCWGSEVAPNTAG